MPIQMNQKKARWKVIELISPKGKRFEAQDRQWIERALELGKITSEWSVAVEGKELSLDDYLAEALVPEEEIEEATDEEDSEFDLPVMKVEDYRQSLTASGKVRRKFDCPNCDSSLVSTEEKFDYCPNCHVGLEFVVDINALSDARERVRNDSQEKSFLTPLTQWVIVVVGVHAVVAGLMGETVLRAVSSDSSGISTILVACYAVALARSFLDVRYISRQTQMAKRQVLTLVAGGRIRTLLEKCEDSLLRDHITNLYEISRRSSEVSQDNLVVLMQSRLHARIRLTEIAGGVLVTIGLVGTIVGLISSFAGIDVVLKNVGEDKQKLLSGFTDTLGGMGTAFYTTLLGSILGGVVMRVLNTIVVSSTDALLSRIAELTEVYILPTLRTTAKRKRRHEETGQ